MLIIHTNVEHFHTAVLILRIGHMQVAQQSVRSHESEENHSGPSVTPM